MKNHLLSTMSCGDPNRTVAVTPAKMNKLEPNNTAKPSWMPSISASSEADRDANTSGAPAPNASNVTPASDSDSLNVFDIFWREGDRCSSATKDR